MTHDEQPLIHDPSYVQGQIDALRSLILALAQDQTKAQFRAMGIDRLEVLRVAMLSQPVPETRLLAVDHCEAWLRTVTS